eukprot:CAMPEP_0206566392 /NCGR_PEP_ID=MMETSP0325_2-20121206/24636_1 /ASSEMBLY_ACC=CAM_ASM_000347 /TAXON_ID=2866 /ORGANISM="Crypthecodinium cohnii, Strain Seligo" /LENGTH=338 /DNA_ID=CAMNT_0054069423 /DNA_START=34 /DNA_END=1050 /DNA_ORIENTATION=-
MTNTLRVDLPPNMSLKDLFLEQYGEVAVAEMIGVEPPKAIVSFFDVRAAARAAEGMAGLCEMGPQCGERTVRLPADTPFKVEDLTGLSNIDFESNKGCGWFVIEFFDIRDAARCHDRFRAPDDLPPGLGYGESPNAPPGLELGPDTPLGQALPPPSKSAPKANYEVKVRGLPAKLLSQMMLEAILQQAGLVGTIVQWDMKTGKTSGDVVFGFDRELQALQCVHHFSGCQWDPSGPPVTAKVISSGSPPTGLPAGGAGKSKFAPSQLSAAAPEFVPTTWKSQTPREAAGGSLSTVAGQSRTRALVGSDTSTEVSDSEEVDRVRDAKPPGVSAVSAWLSS